VHKCKLTRVCTHATAIRNSIRRAETPATAGHHSLHTLRHFIIIIIISCSSVLLASRFHVLPHIFRHMSQSLVSVNCSGRCCCCLRRGQHWRRYLPKLYTIATALLLLVPPSPLNISSPGKGIQRCNQRGRSSRAPSNHVIHLSLHFSLLLHLHHLISSLHHQSLNQTSIIQIEHNLIFKPAHISTITPQNPKPPSIKTPPTQKPCPTPTPPSTTLTSPPSPSRYLSTPTTPPPNPLQL
jgi:hypothetical protein